MLRLSTRGGQTDSNVPLQINVCINVCIKMLQIFLSLWWKVQSALQPAVGAAASEVLTRRNWLTYSSNMNVLSWTMSAGSICWRNTGICSKLYLLLPWHHCQSHIKISFINFSANKELHLVIIEIKWNCCCYFFTLKVVNCRDAFFLSRGCRTCKLWSSFISGPSNSSSVWCSTNCAFMF